MGCQCYKYEHEPNQGDVSWYGIGVCYYSTPSFSDINIQITLTGRKFISSDRKARKIGE